MNVGKITSHPINPTPATNANNSTNSSKNIQNQIATKQQHLNRLTSDSKLDEHEKEKKRREIQKEIEELNRKLELARLKQEEADKKAAEKLQKTDARKAQILDETNAKADEAKKLSSEKVDASNDKYVEEKQPIEASKPVETEEVKPKHVDMAIEDVQQMLTADYELQKELTQKHVAAQIDSTVNKIEAEIKQDRLYGANPAPKEAEIEAIRTKENFWTEETQKKQTEKQQETQVETNKATGINMQAKLNIDTI